MTTPTSFALERYFGWMRDNPTWQREYTAVADMWTELKALRAERDALHSLVFELYCEVGGSPTHFSDWLSASLKDATP